MRARVFSGVQPSGNLHIGNYLGALKNWVRIQHDYESIFCIVDLHAVTIYQDPAELQAKITELAALFLASGIDPKHSSIIVQSSVPAHAELAWMLTCVTPVGWLSRMTQFKAKAEKQETVGDGLLQYPVLMAADIMLYQAAIVPVGDDQAQHLELTRDIAQRFNSLYGDTFVMPATHLPTVGARVMGLDDPLKKMSKSEPGALHAVALLDPPALIRKKILRATTDSNPAVDFSALGPGVENLLNIFQAFSQAQIAMHDVSHIQVVAQQGAVTADHGRFAAQNAAHCAGHNAIPVEIAAAINVATARDGDGQPIRCVIRLCNQIRA